MKKILWIILIVSLSIFILALILIWKLIMDSNYDENVEELKTAKYITEENNNLNTYEYIHQLTHAFVVTNKNNVEIIAPTDKARTLAKELCEENIYRNGDIKIYSKIGYIVEKLGCGTIDNDIVELHNIVAEKSGHKDCIASSLNYDVIDKIIHNDEYFSDEEQEYGPIKGYMEN